MKTVDLAELISKTLEHVVFEQWKHEGHIDGMGTGELNAVIDGKNYHITITEKA